MDYIKYIEPLTKSREYREGLGLPDNVEEKYEMLAAGEYNVNLSFIHPVTGKKLVLRINQGSQMHLDNQIEYEANTLHLLQNSGRTPKLYYVDGSKKYLDKGILVMEYLPGVALDYTRDLNKAADILVDIHRQALPEDTGLIEAGAGFSFVLDECEEMFKHYTESNYYDEDIKNRIRKLLGMGWEMSESQKDSFEGLYKCLINTELNSTNFLINEAGKNYLIDWEKAVLGFPAQDIGHFLAPTSTFWKTDIILTRAEIEGFIENYINKASKYFDTKGIKETSLAFIKINCLRGLSWCAMAYVQYKEADKEIMNESTRVKLGQYLEDSFIRQVEDIFNNNK